MWLWYHALQLVSAFSLGVYFSYILRLVDFVANLDVESLVLSSSSATHLLATSRAQYRTMAFAMREALVGLGNTAFEGLDSLKPAVIFIKTWILLPVKGYH